MRASLASRGMYVDEAWVSEAVRGTSGSEEAVYVQYLHCDLRLASSGGNLPSDVAEWREGVLEGRHVLQLEAREDVGDDTARKDSRTLKVLLTDGRVDVAAFERRPIDDLADASLGAKLFLQDVAVRRGLLLLDPSCARLLGGAVKEGAAALLEENDDERRGEEQGRRDVAATTTTTTKRRKNVLAYDDDDEKDEEKPPPAKKMALKEAKTYSLLRDFEERRGPASAAVWAFVATLRKYYWSSSAQRYVLIVALQDSSATIDAVFAEAELARLFRRSSAQVHALSEADREAAGRAVSQKLETYEGVLKLEKKQKKNTPPPRGPQQQPSSSRRHDGENTAENTKKKVNPDDLPQILSCDKPTDDERRLLKNMLLKNQHL